MRFITDDRPTPSGGGGQLEVLALGLPRSATSSLQAALEGPLGYAPCMHMAQVAPHAWKMDVVLEALSEGDRERRHKLLRRLFDGYRATTDFPGIAFADDLMDMYPDAPVVLSLRATPEAWAASYRQLRWFATWWFLLPCLLWGSDRQHYRVHQAADALMESKLGIRDVASPDCYVRYNEWLREEAARRGRPVLEFHAEDGYPALCDFLGKPRPPVDVKFPHLNDASEIAFLRKVLLARGILSWIALGGTLWAGWRYGPGLARGAVAVVQHWLS